MFDPRKLIDDLLASNVPGTGGTVRGAADRATQFAKDNPIATGAIAAVLLGTGAGRRVAGSALRIGGLAAIAGLAYKAYQNYQQGSAPGTSGTAEMLPAPQGSAFDPAAAQAGRKGQGEDDFSVTVIRAMIAAARADGTIDEAERGQIADRLKLSGLPAEAQSLLVAEMAKPVDLDALVAATTTEAEKVELYTASRLAIQPDSRSERAYLDLLAGRLGLPDALVEHVEATVAQAKG